MSRLTTNKNECNREMICRHEECDVCEEYCPHLQEDNCPCLQEVIEKLGQYEDAEEQGLFIKLPCKVGDTVYVIGSLSEFGLKDEIELEVFECVVNKITLYNKYGITMQMDCKEHCSLCWSMNIKKFNELVFLNKDIAEQKLVELHK